MYNDVFKNDQLIEHGGRQIWPPKRRWFVLFKAWCRFVFVDKLYTNARVHFSDLVLIGIVYLLMAVALVTVVRWLVG
jgi:hypothetical protein